MLNWCHSKDSAVWYMKLAVACFTATAASLAYYGTLNLLPVSLDFYVNVSSLLTTHSSVKYPGGKTAGVLFSEKYGGKLKLVVISRIPAYRTPMNDSVITCGEHLCLLTSNRSRMSEADGIIVDVFLLNRLDPRPVRTSNNQVWVFFTREPWSNFKDNIPLRHWDGIFNWTVTYQRNSDVVIPYSKMVRQRTELEKGDWDAVLGRKTRSVLWFVSNCHTGSKREVYVQQLRKHINVDIVGKCGTPTCDGDVDRADVCYPKYRFYLAFENTFCKDYLTEKFFRTFSHHIIPIVRAYDNPKSHLHVPRSDLFINTADFRSPRHLARYLHYLEKNSTAYVELLKMHAQYVSRSGGNGHCAVCTRLHHLESYRRSYPSISAFMKCVKPVNPRFH